ncbi:flagellar biosynthetic protein FliO [Dyella marensis]|uniref:Flagellar protein n=1 Tax=Dyella marensis TaxID=500610 RepID=A0A1I2EHX2_9GAMM|nr:MULTISPECIES: flagellar biosynthetic protein FliO [Dyella]SFE92116.1 flagellar protein FliO/FliZ [Dyella marensis]
MKRLLSNVMAGLTWPSVALAADSPEGGSLWLGLLLPLIAVCAALLAWLWWLRKGQTLRGPGGPLKVVQAVAVGARERVVVVDAAERRLVLGVTAQRVELIAELRRDDNAK